MMNGLLTLLVIMILCSLIALATLTVIGLLICTILMVDFLLGKLLKMIQKQKKLWSKFVDCRNTQFMKMPTD